MCKCNIMCNSLFEVLDGVSYSALADLAPFPEDTLMDIRSTRPLNFDDHAVSIAKRQYFQPEDEGLEGLFGRVAAWVASPEKGDARDAL